jgi:hypothetical protein
MGEIAKQEASFDKEALQRDADTHFKANPEATELTATSDGLLFTNKKFAVDHSHSLEDKTLTPFKNANSLEVVDKEEITRDDITLSAEQLELLNNGLVKENYNQIKKLKEFLKLETTDNKAETLITALTAYKEIL